MGRKELLLAARTGAVTLIAILAFAPAATAAEPTDWLVGTETGIRAAGATPGTQISPGIRLVDGDKATLKQLRSRPDVRWVEPNRQFTPSSLAAPTDSFFRQQWALRDARVPQGMAHQRRRRGHRGGARHRNGHDPPRPRRKPLDEPNEVPGNGVDDDSNGFVDDVHGVDMVNGDGDPADGVGHGTAMAGVIGGRGNNGGGISGVAWRVRLMPVKVLPDEGFGTTATLVAGLRYALANGARVVNMSLNGADRSLALEEAIAAAEAQGVLVVTSAGNDGADRDSVPSYPASIASPACSSVASSNRGGRLGYGSAYGASSVDIAAPGDNILTTDLRGRYGTHSGTSFAAAYVSGAAALLAAAQPRRIRRSAAQRAAGIGPARRSLRPASARRAAQRGRRDEAARAARGASLPAP